MTEERVVEDGEKKDEPTIESLKPKIKICICGCSDHKDLAPWGNPEYTIWGVNNLFLSIPEEKRTNIGAWFEIHHIEKKNNQWLRRGSKEFRGLPTDKYIEMLATLKCPIYMQKHWDEIPTSVPYPLKEMIDYWKTDYINNTITYELLYAGYLIHTQPETYAPHVAIYGVDMATTSDLLGNGEYQHQRPSCEWALGLLAGTGITLELPKESDLLKVRFLYGFQEPEQRAFDAKLKNYKKSLTERMNHSMMVRDIEARKVEQYQGALQALHEIKRVWD